MFFNLGLLAMLACGALPPGPGPFPEAGIMAQPVPGAARALTPDGWKVGSEHAQDIANLTCGWSVRTCVRVRTSVKHVCILGSGAHTVSEYMLHAGWSTV